MDSADDAGDGDSSAADWDEAGSEPESEPATQEEPEPEVVLHHHTSDCYEEQEVLTCGIESDHVHQDYCYDQETGELLCTEHEHTDDCYTLEEVLVCGQEEGEPEETDDGAALYDGNENSAEESDSAEEPETVADPEPEKEATKPETDDEIDRGYTVHHHTAECYGKVLICGKEEHEHTAACLVNPNAEIDAEYDAKTPARTDADWAEDMVLVAKSQLGYTESKADVDEDGNGYTMYADQYYKDKPMVYADWDCTFVAYCLYHAGVPQDVIPQYASISALRGALARMNSAYYGDDPQDFGGILPGDIVMYKNAEGRETIGVVSDAAVDEETDLTTALTVISGDVAIGCESDGETTIDQVAEVSVALNEVTSFVSVNAAEGYGISDLMDEKQKTGEDNETLHLENYVKELVLKKIINGTAVEIKENEAVIDGNDLQITFDFEIPEGTMSDTNRTMVYKLPAGVKLDKVETGTIMPLGGSGNPIGTYRIETDGTITLTFNQKSDSFDPSKQVTGQFGFTAKADVSQAGENGNVSFPGVSTTIQIASKADIQVEKTCTEVKEDENGNRTAYFKVVVSTGTRTGTPLTIVDQITNWKGANLTGSYSQDSLKVYGPDVDTDEITAPYTKEFTTNSSGFPQFTITGLPELVKGQTYTVVYEVKLSDNFNNQGYGKFHNYVYAQSGEKKGEANFEKTWNNLIVKNGTYDEKNGLINWEITVTRPEEVQDLKNYVVSDTVTAGEIKDSEVKITYVDDRSQTQELTSGQLTINDRNTGFTYTFPENSTAKEYKIKYTTTVPSDAASVTNGAKIVTPKNKTYTDNKTITIEHRRNNTDKQKAGNTIRAGRYADWKITQTIANEWTEFTIVDTISAQDDDGNVLPNVHYAHASELDAELKKNMTFALTDGSTSKFTDLNEKIDISIQYYADDEQNIQPSDTTTKIKKFVIRVHKGSYDGTPIKSMEVSYSTQLDLSEIQEGKKLFAENTANNVKREYEYTKPTTAPKIEKKSSDQNGKNYKDTGVTVKYKEDGTYIYYQLYVNVLGTELSSLNGSLTVKDVLQDGLEFVPSKDGNVDVYGWFYYKSKWRDSQSPWGPGSWGRNWNLNDHLTATPSDNNRKLSITISLPTDKTWVDTNPADKPTIVGIYIQYKAKVVDPAWESNPKEFERDYTNNASWEGESASTTTTVKRTNEELTKSAVQESNSNKVHYTLNINKLGLDLLPNSDRINLEDVLTVNTKSPATPDLDSVKLYEANSHKLLDKESYEFSYARTTEGENYKYTIKLKVPDDVALILNYDYTFDLSVLTTPLITNTAKLNGQWDSSVQENLQAVSSWSQAGNNALTVYKVDSLNESLKLKGAVFTLEAYKNSAWETIQRDITTDDNGKFVLSVDTTAEDKLQQNVLYKLTEQTAPAGYLKDDTAHYFIWKASGETDKVAWNAAVGTAGLSGVEQNAVHFYAYGTAQELLVSNERSQLTINKYWKNSDGETTTPPPNTNVTVALYRYQKDADKNTAVPVKQITLSDANNWTAVYPGADDPADTVMEPGWLYFVKEVNTNREYDVLYSKNNESGVEKGGVINITNRHKPDKLTVTKVWAGDSEDTSARPTQITVELYGYAKNDSPDTAKFIDQYTLEAAKGWTLTIDHLNAEMYYYIKEKVPDGYEVSYSKEKLQTGESITLTNTKTIVYELPSTGSPGGTVPYTAGGAAIALAAVLCGYNSRRKRKRGEE